MLNKAIVSILFIAIALPALATEPHPGSRENSECIVKEVQNLFFPDLPVDPDGKMLELLRSKTFADYFPKSEEVVIYGSGQTLKRSKIDKKAVKRFESDWDQLLDLRHAFREIDADLVREGLTLEYGKPYPLITPSIIENVHKSADGKPLTLADLQTRFQREYLNKKYFQHGKFSGWRKHLSPASPYSLTYKGIRKTKWLWEKTKYYWAIGLAIQLSNPFNKPISDRFAAVIDHVESKVIDQTRDKKELARALQQRSQLLEEAEALDFTKMQQKSERLRQWAALESRLKSNHELIEQLRSKTSASPKEAHLAEPVSSDQLLATRITLQTALFQLAQDKSARAQKAKVHVLANLRALDLLNRRSNNASDPTQQEIDQMIDRLAENPAQFQAFVEEYLGAQAQS
jgi:hypothetical protein